MEASTDYPGVKTGDGYAVGSLDDLGETPGFRKVRKGLGVTEITTTVAPIRPVWSGRPT